VGWVISLNALFIGISMDQSEEGIGVLFVIDLAFSIFFLLELALKIRMHGWRRYLCGESRVSNAFDTSLVVIDALQQALLIVAPQASASMGHAPSASLFRIIRIVRLTRLIRLLRSHVYKDLMTMIQGMLGGLHTLMWAMVLFFIFLYVVSLLFREMLGREEKDEIFELFNSVPRSMFTTFRCSFGDCSTIAGAPLFEQVQLDYGGFPSLFYCLFVFTVTIGLFNVISAIFVESTMAAATSLQQEKKAARMQNRSRWSKHMNTLIQRIIDLSPDHQIQGKLSESMEDVYKVTVDNAIIDKMVNDTNAIDALNALDIDPEDHLYLSDILDPDNSGSIAIADFVDGIRRLRGDPRRSDIVSVDLMIRANQSMLDELMCKVGAIHDKVVPLP